MKTIAKRYETSKQAERYQNSLYNKYDYVRLIKSPIFGEDGVYVWQVKVNCTKTVVANKS